MRLFFVAGVVALLVAGCSEAPPTTQTNPTTSTTLTSSTAPTSPVGPTVPTVLSHMGFGGPHNSGGDWMQWHRKEGDGSTSNITTRLSDNQAIIRYAGYDAPGRKSINTTEGPRSWKFFFCSINILAQKPDEEATKRVVTQALDDVNQARVKFEQDSNLKVGSKGSSNAYNLPDYPNCFSYL